jgi:hypothetical protein
MLGMLIQGHVDADKQLVLKGHSLLYRCVFISMYILGAQLAGLIISGVLFGANAVSWMNVITFCSGEYCIAGLMLMWDGAVVFTQCVWILVRDFSKTLWVLKERVLITVLMGAISLAFAYSARFGHTL